MSKDWNIIAYDIRDDRRLRVVARLLEGYGERIQYSVFRCRLSRRDLSRLRWELVLVMKPEDSLLVIPLCERCGENVTESNGRKWSGVPPTYRIL